MPKDLFICFVILFSTVISRICYILHQQSMFYIVMYSIHYITTYLYTMYLVEILLLIHNPNYLKSKSVSNKEAIYPQVL